MCGKRSGLRLGGRTVFYFILIIILISVFTGCETIQPAVQVIDTPVSAYPGPMPSPTPGPSTPKETPARNNCEGTPIEIFRTQLALIPSSDTQQRINVEGKINAWETMIAICEKNTPRTGIPDVTPKFIPSTPRPFPTGIFEGQTGDYHSFEAKIENHWQGIIDGNRVIVFAGAWVNDPSQGFVSVKIASNKGPAIWGYYPSTTKAGALRILSANGSRLIIQQANDQQILYFDVPAMTYVSSLAVTVVPFTPTSILTTPQPRATPYPVP